MLAEPYALNLHGLYYTLFESVSSDIKEMLWAKLPSYYSGDSFVRLIPCKDHINVEASSIMKYVDLDTNMYLVQRDTKIIIAQMLECQHINQKI